MNANMELATFLDQNGIATEAWETTGLKWDELLLIAQDHDAQAEHLRDSAELFARVIQRFPTVHSVRWRVKDAEHLLAKIVRKRIEKNTKYKEISVGNYFEVVTDLVGLRALHLFKEDCFAIDLNIRDKWALTEPATAYVREGDPQDLTDRFRACRFEVKNHPAGYRSVHYVCKTQPLQRAVFTEIQVRTIFEEGWSEIDHRVRYPNFSQDKLVGYFLTIFNRLAGSADEMGTFVQGLTAALRSYDDGLLEANRQKEQALKAMDSMFDDLEALKKQDADTNRTLTALQQEISKLRKLTILDDLHSDSTRNALTNWAGSDSHSLMDSLLKTPTLAELEGSSLQTLAKALEPSGSTNALIKCIKGGLSVQAPRKNPGG